MVQNELMFLVWRQHVERFAPIYNVAFSIDTKRTASKKSARHADSIGVAPDPVNQPLPNRDKRSWRQPTFLNVDSLCAIAFCHASISAF